MEHTSSAGVASAEFCDLVQRACVLAARAHLGQFRPDHTTPFVSHPMRVGLLLATELGIRDPVMIAAAVLHDVLEKTELSEELLACEVGSEVAALVATLTRPEGQDEDTYWARLYAGDWRTRTIKIADVCANLEDGRGSPEDRLEKVRRALVLTDRMEASLDLARSYLDRLLARHVQADAEQDGYAVSLQSHSS
jgi:GTP diphosphokinase / guanosine-3',5'-bis(diphosphate) 3'-diphosphatase